MRKNILLTILCIFSLLLMASCNLQGSSEKNEHTPQITIGYNGNWYIDGVDTGVSAEGKKGEQGVPGVDGTNGTNGKDGIDGINGTNGTNGKDGIDGIDGTNGNSAYEIFLKYYPEYTGTEKDWITDVALNNKCNLFGHNWDEGVVTTPAKEGINGEKTYTCDVCNEHKYEVIPMIKVYANAEIYEENGIKYVNYGSYPQTHVGDETLIAELNKLTETNDRGYYEYDGEEYTKVVATAHSSSLTDAYGNPTCYSDGSEIQNNATEWFKVEPIKWRIISENSDGSYQLYSENILDTTKYYNDSYLRSLDGIDIYPNNYKYSNIRAWLNGYDGTEYKVSDYTNNGFLQRAFKDNENSAIITKEVDNSASTTESSSNKYACENTFDKIYLLSYQDMKNTNYGYDSSDYKSETRYAKATDYAKAVGVSWSTSVDYFNNGYYWLRSPEYRYSDHAHYADGDGYVNFYSVYFSYNFNFGVRVACTINLE